MEELPFSYESKLGEFLSKVIVACQKQIETASSLALLLTVNEILSHTENIITDASIFANQLKELETSLEEKYKKISTIQDSVNEIYADSFYSNILNNVKGIKNQSGEYYWSSIILATIRAIPKYTYIFKKKDEYIPNEKRLIDKSDLEIFLKDLNLKFEEKKAKIEADKSALDNHIIEIKNIIDLENNLKELLTIADNE
jgi:hypothetical protein